MMMMMMPLICAKLIQNCRGKKNCRTIFDSGAFSSRCVCDGKKRLIRACGDGAGGG